MRGVHHRVRWGLTNRASRECAVRLGSAEARHGATAPVALPGDDSRLETFGRNRQILTTIAENLAAASPAATQELIGMVVGRVDTGDRAVAAIASTPAAAPLNSQEVVLAPPEGLEPPTPALGRRRSIL